MASSAAAEGMTTNGDVAFLYAGALLPAVLVGIIASSIVLSPWTDLPRSLAWGLTVGPAFAAGAGVYTLVAGRMLRYVVVAGLRGVLGHLVRCTALYSTALISAAVLYGGRDNFDLGFYGALFVWSASTALGGAAADAGVARRMRRAGKPASHKTP
jgi:hypothetical protein